MFRYGLISATIIRSSAHSQIPAISRAAVVGPRPCVGDGSAFQAITRGTHVIRYGTELDAYRANQRIDRMIQGNTLEVHCPVENFGLLFENPRMAGPGNLS